VHVRFHLRRINRVLLAARPPDDDQAATLHDRGAQRALSHEHGLAH